jgi:hypothetical protein
MAKRDLYSSSRKNEKVQITIKLSYACRPHLGFWFYCCIDCCYKNVYSCDHFILLFACLLILRPQCSKIVFGIENGSAKAGEKFLCHEVSGIESDCTAILYNIKHAKASNLFSPMALSCVCIAYLLNSHRKKCRA